MRPIKLIVIAILVMLIISTVAYFFVTNQVQDIFTDIVNPPYKCDYEKFSYGWGTIWENKDDSYNQIVWSHSDNRLIVNWDQTYETVRTDTVYRPFDYGYFIKLQQKTGSGYQDIHEQNTGDNEYTTLSQHSGYMYPTLELVKNNLNMEEDTWNWSMCVMGKVQKGDA